MDKTIEDAIETVDSAREHKCELEGRKNQLISAMAQITGTAICSKQEVESYFNSLQEHIIKEIHERKKCLFEEISNIEIKALEPLQDCQTVVDEGIEEASTVISSGENLLNHDLETESGFGLVSKFVATTSNLALNSVPEVPLAVEVPSISVSFNSNLIPTIAKALRLEGKICQHSPVQIVDFKAIPGAIIVSWADVDDDFTKSSDQKFVYKLQSYHGKIKANDRNEKHSTERKQFTDAYVGLNSSCVVRNLFSNSIYTFRVCRCSYESGDESSASSQWSPWSVYQEKMTTMPGYTWDCPKDEASYDLSDRNKVATKKTSLGGVIYSNISFLVGYPISFKIDMEGKKRGKNDCIALCTKRDPDSTGIHTKEGTFCIMTDGSVWINGVCSKTKFAKLCRGTLLSFELETSQRKFTETKSKCAMFRATITVGQHEAVFDWLPAKSGSFNFQSLVFAAFFLFPGWRITII